MDKNNVKVGILGFGEVGRALADGISKAGATDVKVYDMLYSDERFKEKIEQQAAAIDVTLARTAEEFADGRDVILSVVTADSAVPAASSVAPYIEAGTLYVDHNSCTPKAKLEIQEMMAGKNVSVVDVGMGGGGVKLEGHRLPMIASGPKAAEFKEIFTPYDLRIDVVSDEVGAAASVRMSRTILAKGIEALYMEMLLLSRPYKVTDKVIDFIQQTFDENSFTDYGDMMVRTGVIHAERRMHEVEHAISMARDMGVEPRMGEAVKERFKWLSEFKLGDYFDREVPEDLETVLKVMEERTGLSKPGQ